MAQLHGNSKRTAVPRPNRCKFCGERHYVSIVCDAKREALAPPPPPVPVVLTMPDMNQVGRFPWQARQDGTFRTSGRVREWSSVIPDPAWTEEESA